MTGMEMKAQMDGKRRETFFGKRYFYATPNDGRVVIGVMQGLGEDCWFVGYFRENGARKKINSIHLPVNKSPRVGQDELNAWARKRQLREVFI